MANKAIQKEIREIAAQLPAMSTRGFAKEIVTGEDLFKKGVRTLPGKDGEEKVSVVRDFNYIESNQVDVPVNHERRLRHAHKKLGVLGIAAYVKQVRTSLQAQNVAN